MIRWILAGCYLAVCVSSDLKIKQISLWWSKCMLTVGILLRLSKQAFMSAEISIKLLAGLFPDAFPGAVCMLLSCLSGGKIGMGDGWMILITGIFLGAEKTMQITWAAFLFGACYGIVLLLKGKDCRHEFAFAPCIFLAFAAAVLQTVLSK